MVTHYVLSLSMNLVLVLIKLHSMILFKAIFSVVNTISTCQPLPNKGLVVPVVLSSLLVPLLSSHSMSTFLQQTKQLSCSSIICLFSLLLSKDCGLSTQKPAIPSEWHGFWSTMCPHTKIWLIQKSSLFRRIKNSLSRTNSTTHLRLSVFEKDGDALIVIPACLPKS